MRELVAITGGAGFIGSHLVEGFARNRYAVRVVDNFSTGRLTNLAQVEGPVEVRQVDVRNLDELTSSFQQASIVLHHAGLVSVPQSVRDPNYTYEVNATGTLNVLRAAVRAGVRRVINASSSSVYGNDGAGRQQETAIPCPLSPYGVSKWMGELYAAQFARGTSLETVSLRYFNVFGPRQDQDSGDAAVIPRFLRNIADGVRPTIFGDGQQTRDFTFVENIVAANLRAATAPLESGTTTNVATGRGFSLLELIRAFNQFFGSDLEPVYEPERPGDIKHSCADVSKSEELLGAYQVVPFHEGLKKTATWLLSAPERPGTAQTDPAKEPPTVCCRGALGRTGMSPNA
ncbi:MAG TPA: NAD-dependent epimerase/dehydratase family protein [Chthoniobacterales bacterium]